MEKVTRAHLAELELLMKEPHIVGNDYPKIKKLIAQASAASEQEVAHRKVRTLSMRPGMNQVTLYCERSVPGFADPGCEFYITNVDPSGVERLRAENKRLDLALTQADHNYDCDRQQFEQKLAEADQKISSVVEYIQGMINAAGNQPSVATGYLRDILDTLLSATAQPAEVKPV